MTQRTLSILKPDAVKGNIIGNIIKRIEDSGLKVIKMYSTQLTKKQAEEFYAVHYEQPFYNDLVNFMISGTVIVQILEGPDAVRKYREIMGETDPKKAKKGTIRGDFADSIEANCVHGSDSDSNAIKEINFFFSLSEQC